MNIIQDPTSYPPTRRDDLVDLYHGTEVPDPYRWLEDPGSPATQALVSAQNELTRHTVDGLPVRSQFEKRLTTLWDYSKYTPPSQWWLTRGSVPDTTTGTIWSSLLRRSGH